MALETLRRPTFAWVPAHDSTSGAEAADLAVELGMSPMPEQRLALDALLAERRMPDGSWRWAALEAALVCGRQNLKTWCLQMSVLHDLFLRDDVRLVVWTAHRFRTTESSFRDFRRYIDSSDFLSKRVKQIRTGTADKSIELTSGARLEFMARTSGGGRGLTGDVIVLDEALELSPAEMAALLPSLSAKSITGNPQVRYGSSAGKFDSEILRNLRDRGRPGGDPSLAYLEWAALDPCQSPVCSHDIDAPGCRLDDQLAWEAANPALDRLISREHVSAERRALPPLEFARERLGWWDDPLDGGGPALPLMAWEQAADPGSAIAGDVVFGLDVTPDRRMACICVYGLREDGLGHLEVVDYRPDASWVADRLAQLCQTWSPRAVVLDPQGAAGGLLPELQAHGIEPLLMTARTVGQAAGSLFDALTAGQLRHLDQASLNAAAMGAKRRPIGDAWAFGRRGSDVDISPLVAVTLARWGFVAEGPPVDPVLNVW